MSVKKNIFIIMLCSLVSQGAVYASDHNSLQNLVNCMSLRALLEAAASKNNGDKSVDASVDASSVAATRADAKRKLDDLVTTPLATMAVDGFTSDEDEDDGFTFDEDDGRDPLECAMSNTKAIEFKLSESVANFNEKIEFLQAVQPDIDSYVIQSLVAQHSGLAGRLASQARDIRKSLERARQERLSIESDAVAADLDALDAFEGLTNNHDAITQIVARLIQAGSSFDILRIRVQSHFDCIEKDLVDYEVSDEGDDASEAAVSVQAVSPVTVPAKRERVITVRDIQKEIKSWREAIKVIKIEYDHVLKMSGKMRKQVKKLFRRMLKQEKDPEVLAHFHRSLHEYSQKYRDFTDQPLPDYDILPPRRDYDGVFRGLIDVYNTGGSSAAR